jgi:hypothetical protein
VWMVSTPPYRVRATSAAGTRRFSRRALAAIDLRFDAREARAAVDAVGEISTTHRRGRLEAGCWVVYRHGLE